MDRLSIQVQWLQFSFIRVINPRSSNSHITSEWSWQLMYAPVILDHDQIDRPILPDAYRMRDNLPYQVSVIL